MRARLVRQALRLLPFALLAGCAGAPPPPPEKPKPAPTVVKAPPPETTVTKPPPPPPLEIGSSFVADPVEPLPPGAVARCGTTRMRAADPKATGVSNTGQLWAVDSLGTKWMLRDLNRGVDVAKLPVGSRALFTPDASIAVITNAGGSGKVAFFSVPGGSKLGEVKIPLPAPPPAKKTKKGGALGTLGGLWSSTSIDETVASPDGKGIVVTTSDGSVHLIDIGTLTLVKTNKIPPKSRLAGVSRGGARAVFETMNRDETAMDIFLGGAPRTHVGYSVMDLRTGAIVRKETFKMPPKDPLDPDAVRTLEHIDAQLRISPDGTKLLRLENGEITTIEVASGKEMGTVDTPGGSSGAGGSGSPFGSGSLFGKGFHFSVTESLFEIFDDGRALLDSDILDLDDGSRLSAVGEGFEAISLNGTHVATREGRVYDLSSGVPEARAGNDGAVVSLGFLPNNALVAVSGQATVWSTDNGVPMKRLPYDTRLVATAPGRSIAFFGAGVATLMDETFARRDLKQDARVGAARFAPDGGTIFLGIGAAEASTGTLVAEDVSGDATKKQTLKLKGHLESMAVSPDGATLAIAQYSPETNASWLKLLSASGLSTTTEVLVSRTGDVEFAGPDTLLHSTSYSGVSVHKVPSLDEVRRIHHGVCCKAIAVSPDGKRVAGAERRGFMVWDVASRRLLGEVQRAHREDIESLAFSVDGRHLATGSDDTTVLLWDVAKLGVRPLPEAAETRVKGAAEAKLFIEGRSSVLRIQADGTLVATSGLPKDKPPPLKAVTRIASSDDAHCAIAEGKVRCWGSTRGAALGVPEKQGTPKWRAADLTTPTTVAVKDPVDVQLDGSYACALSRDGDLVCWGRMGYSQPGAAPAKVLGDVKSFAVGRDATCAVGKDAQVRCWSGAAAPGTLQVPDVAQIVAPLSNKCILTTSGEVQCRGSNEHDQLGDDTGLDRVDFAPVVGVTGVTSIVAQRLGACALTKMASVFCWGEIGSAPLDHPTKLPALDGATAVRIDGDSVCGLLGDRADCVVFKAPD